MVDSGYYQAGRFSLLEHDPEKRIAGFPKGSCSRMNLDHDPINGSDRVQH